MEVKDYFAIATGVIGCAAGLIALVRGWFLDKRLYWEPYFEKKWKQISAPWANNIETTNRWLTMLTTDLSVESLHDLAISRSVPPSHSNIEWNYDRRLEKRLKLYTSAFHNLTAQLSHYNMLVALLDGKTYHELQIKDAFVAQGHVPEETRKDHMDNKQKIIELIKYYGGSSEVALDELKANNELAADIRNSKMAIELSIATLRKFLTRLQADIDFYNAKFTI